MSMPSASDDGDPATRWDETYIRQEFDAVYKKWLSWIRGNKHEFPSDDFQKTVDDADRALCQLSDYMTGKL